MSLAWLVWDPDPVAFYIPYFHHPIAWYSLFFVAGFIAGFWILVPLLQKKIIEDTSATEESARAQSLTYVDGLTWCIILATLVGARLGHVFLYDWPRFREHPLDIFKTWEGGLASHGGALAVILAVYLYYRYRKNQIPSLSFLGLMDLLAIPVAFVATCIRIGNFINQEILGTPTTLPWGIVFGHPLGFSQSSGPLHPVQLYEGIAYFGTFLLLQLLWWKKRHVMPPGTLIGLFFVLIFGSRFFIEFLKAPQSLMIDESFLQTGQYLSIPFVLLGIALLAIGKMNRKKTD